MAVEALVATGLAAVLAVVALLAVEIPGAESTVMAAAPEPADVAVAAMAAAGGNVRSIVATAAATAFGRARSGSVALSGF
ncbi:hypothetical protein AA23498_2030 [Acetobacter nitrogenifigens DSM 23921 = NBRC 105050]|uniref:Uncharacterized protein n=1 Tax=Acetobacter nitrogenifigens DSM 23921 = NBRC 105050 TaxID=1120919 RepID=A0A511X6E7_9PROT|nr:hypothetical protein AA23498_2030 [Acetobacter nitrogenifigens DSM 23921 = NBRC 105050]GEN58523.1 hypothetical protein ANI02nite_04070 [Acetobacter nitrogenifigens DSM 23921 = NBRC 105050]